MSVVRTILFLFLAVATSGAAALDHVSFREGEKIRHVRGRVLVKAKDGALLVKRADGGMLTVQAEDLVSHRVDPKPFALLKRKELGEQLLAEMPQGFKLLHTRNYLICYNTSKAYAQWNGALLEKLYAAFFNFWTRRGFELHEPRQPLVAILFDSYDSYKEYAQRDLGKHTRGIIGYYSQATNRVAAYDLSGAQEAQRRSGVTSLKRVSDLMALPGAERTVATIVHEATHQLTFNTGMFQRYADVPAWLSEGLAIYFETPEPSQKGWRSIGRVSRVQLAAFRRYQKRRPLASLKTLITTDDRFFHVATAADAHAEAWALVHFLMTRHEKTLTDYVRRLGELSPGEKQSPAARLAAFQAAFGDLKALDKAFLKFLERVRP